MKKIYHLLALVILGAFTFTSCDDFLDMQPTNSGNAEGAVGTVADAQVVINGVMSAMTSSSYYGRNLLCTVMLRAVTSRFCCRTRTGCILYVQPHFQQQYLFRFLEPWILLHSAGQHLVEQH